MRAQYVEWIQHQVSNPTGKCLDVCYIMQKAFAELILVRGHYLCTVWGEREHWWLKDGDEIVDPTASQFPSKGRGQYIEWDESKPEPTGRCMNCGGYCYDSAHFCSPGCESIVMADYL
jgi:hypothetical protein